MAKIVWQIAFQRVLPAFVGALGAFVAANYSFLHSAFCSGGVL